MFLQKFNILILAAGKQGIPTDFDNKKFFIFQRRLKWHEEGDSKKMNFGGDSRLVTTTAQVLIVLCCA